jgi:hypothetical protein
LIQVNLPPASEEHGPSGIGADAMRPDEPTLKRSR